MFSVWRSGCHDDVPSWNVLEMVNAHFWNGRGAFSILVYFDPVRIRRVTSFLDVEANAGDSAYQLWQGMLAFGVGGTNGVGLGLGRQQMHFLPEAHTDFIFPVIGEELGLIFTLGIVICFLFLFVSVYWLEIISQTF